MRERGARNARAGGRRGRRPAGAHGGRERARERERGRRDREKRNAILREMGVTEERTPPGSRSRSRSVKISECGSEGLAFDG